MVNLILGNRFPSALFIFHSFILSFLAVIHKYFLGFLRFPKYLWKFHENVSYEVPIRNVHRKAQSSRRRWLTAVLSQHRTYRSVYGAFNSWRAQTDRLWLNHKSHCLSVFLYSAPKSQLCYCWYTNTFCDCLLLLTHSVLGFQVWLDFYISF